VRWLSLVVLIGLCVVSEVAAQTAQEPAGGFTGLKEGRTVVVIEESGAETRGQLRRFTPDALTLTQEGRELVFQRQQVVAVYERGDSLMNGLLIGLAAGAVLGAVASAVDCTKGGFFVPERDCTGSERAGSAAVGAALGGAVGAGVGVGIDALISGKRLVYQRPPGTEARAISIVPAVGRSGARVLVGVTW